MKTILILMALFVSHSSYAQIYNDVTVEDQLILDGKTASTVPYLDASKVMQSSSVTPTELGYLSGVTSAIQTQLGGKEPSITAATAADYFRGDKTFQPFDAAARSAVLTGYVSGAGVVAATDSILQAIEKLNGNQVASIVQTITNGDMTHASSSDVLFDALALKEDLANKNANNGYAGLDAGGKIPSSLLPNTVMEYQGNWNATTNTPALANGTGNAGDVYRANVAGSTDFGAGAIAFNVGDWAVYNGAIWEYAANSNLVMSVNGQQGVVVLDTDDIAEGTNLYFTEARVRATPLTGFVSGAGTVAATDSVLQAFQKIDGNITSATTKTPNTPAYFDGTGVLQALPNWGINPEGNYNLNDASNTAGGYTVMGASKTGDVTGGTTQGYNFYVNGDIAGYYGFNSNLQGTSSAQVEHVTLNSSQATTGNYFMVNGNMTGNITTGGIFGLNMAMSGDSDNVSPVNASNTGDTGYINALSFSNSGTISNNMTGVNITNSGAITNGYTGLLVNNSSTVGSGYYGLSMSNSSAVDNISAINYSNTGSITNTYSNIININDDASSADSVTGANIFLQGTYSTGVTGLAIDLNSATATAKQSLSVNGGQASINSSVSTAIAMPPNNFAMNYLGGNLTVASGFPLALGEYGFGNNLATVVDFEDDMGADMTTLGLGYTHVGFVGQISVDAGKTVADMNMALAGGGIPAGSSGNITNMNMYHAAGTLNSGGTVAVTNMRGFYSNSPLCSMATNCWAFFDGSNAENYLSKLAIATASNKVGAGLEFDVTGQARITGDLEVTGVADLGDGSVSVTQPPLDSSTLIATTEYVDDAIIAAGATSPLTTKGDIYTYDTGNARLAAGTNGQILSANSATATGLEWIAAPSAPVSSVFGRTGAVVAANGDYTASNVTNVAAGNIAAVEVQAAINELDSEKQALLVNSAGLASALSDETGTGVAVFSASPALTGNPTAPTQAANDNSTKLATTAYADAAASAAGGSATSQYLNISANTTGSGISKVYFADTSGGAFTFTLPAAASFSGVSFEVINTDFGGANDLSVARTGGDTINGGTSDTLTPGMTRKYVSNGSNWFVFD